MSEFNADEFVKFCQRVLGFTPLRSQIEIVCTAAGRQRLLTARRSGLVTTKLALNAYRAFVDFMQHMDRSEP